MTFEEWIKTQDPAVIRDAFSAAAGWAAGQAAERERIKSRVKGAAESIWGIRDFVDKRYGLYVGPPLNVLEQFVNRLLEET